MDTKAIGCQDCKKKIAQERSLDGMGSLWCCDDCWKRRTADPSLSKAVDKVILTTFDSEGKILDYECDFFDVWENGLVKGYKYSSDLMVRQVPIIATTAPCMIVFIDDRAYLPETSWKCDVIVRHRPHSTDATYYRDCENFQPYYGGVSFVNAGKIYTFVNTDVTASRFVRKDS